MVNITTYGNKTFWNRFSFSRGLRLQFEKHSKYDSYGRCINLSAGMLIGALIDKTIFICLPKAYKFVSMIIPPFAVSLATKGKLLKQIRFEKTFSKPLEILLSHFVQK